MRPERGLLLAHVYGGLGNRMRTLLSAAEVADLDGRRLVYVWPRSHRFRPSLRQLWEFEHPAAPRLVSRIAGRMSDAIREEVPPADERSSRWLLYVKSPHTLKREDGSFYPFAHRLRALTLAEDIADEVRTFWAGRFSTAPYVALSVRANAQAHSRTLQESPVDWYLARMGEIRAQHPDVPFFLSCDSPSAEQYMKSKFDDVHSIEDRGGYNSTRGLKKSVADLYLMASSDWIVGPHWSTFAPMSAALADDKVPYETSVDAWPDELVLGSAGQVEDPTRPWQRSSA
jgi:hypothetical protein